MKFTLVLASLAAVAVGNEISSLYNAAATTITVDQAKAMLGFFKKFDDCTVTKAKEIIESLTPEQIEQGVALHNKIIDGTVACPTSREEGLALIKEYVPSLYDAFVALNQDIIDRYNKVNAAGQEKILELEKEMFAVAGKKDKTAIVDLSVEVCEQYFALDASVHDSIAAGFPETVKCMDQTFYKSACKAAKALKEANYDIRNFKVIEALGKAFSDERFAQ